MRNFGLVSDRSFAPKGAKGHRGFKVHDTDVVGQTMNNMHRLSGNANTKVKGGRLTTIAEELESYEPLSIVRMKVYHAG